MILISLTILFCLISSISAVELSENDINQNYNDNIISTIDGDNQEINSIESIDDDLENNLGKADENELKEANAIYISGDGNDSTGDGSKNKPYKSIKKGIDNSNDGSTIYLSEGTFDGLNLTVDKRLTIEGKTNKTIIDGQNSSRIFIMNSDAKLTLIGLNLINGNIDADANGFGGAIMNNGGELTLINCTVKDSYASANGGGIFSNNGKLTIIKSNIINNSAVQYGGGIYSAGITNIADSFFTENHVIAEKGVGGAVACGGIASFNNTVFFKNYAIYSAGAILNLANATINNCSFINQTTNYTGGAISNHNYMIINNSIFSGGKSRFYAAAILAPPSGQHVVTEAYNTIFERNQVGAHGAVSNNFPDTELKMENCAIVENVIMLEQGGKTYGDIALDDNASVLYCWWGQNEISPYYYSAHSERYESWKINASKWLVMEFTSSNGEIDRENNNVLNVNLKHYFDNETKETYEYNEDINLPLVVKFYNNYGKTIKEVRLVNGSASINYLPDANTKTVYAKINNQTLEINVKEKEDSNLAVNDLEKNYQDNNNLEVKLTDSNNEGICNKTVNMIIFGKTYTRTTDENGHATFTINANPGSYEAKIMFIDNDYKNAEKTVQISVLKNKTSIIAQDLVKYYKNGTQLSIKLEDVNKKALESRKVIINITGKDYVRTTNKNGIAVLNINLKAGTYTAKISFNEDKQYLSSEKTINVYVKSPKITVSNKNIKRNSYLTVQFKEKDGKSIKNEKVKLTFNGKTYTKTTDSNGQVKIKITVNLGTYTLKAGFNSVNPYGSTVSTNKIKVI